MTVPASTDCSPVPPSTCGPSPPLPFPCSHSFLPPQLKAKKSFENTPDVPPIAPTMPVKRVTTIVISGGRFVSRSSRLRQTTYPAARKRPPAAALRTRRTIRRRGRSPTSQPLLVPSLGTRRTPPSQQCVPSAAAAGGPGPPSPSPSPPPSQLTAVTTVASAEEARSCALSTRRLLQCHVVGHATPE